MRHHGDHGPRLHLAAEQRGRHRARPVQVYQGLARTAVNNIFRAYFYIYQIPFILLMHLDRVNSRNCLHDRQVLEVRHVAPV